THPGTPIEGLERRATDWAPPRRQRDRRMNSTAALPVPLADSSAARLPATYEEARAAIAECERIDECKGWSDRAAALASYARQAKDDSLRVMAVRIQARAERRC